MKQSVKKATRITLDERVDKELRRGVSFDNFVHRNMPSSFSQHGREAIVARFFVVSFEHHRAISHLLGAGQYITSARSLMRPLLESATRGGWLSRIATQEEVTNAISGAPKFPGPLRAAQLLDSLGAAPPLASVASKIDLLHDYTHTGIRQANLQVVGNQLGGHYDSEESVEILVDAMRIFAAATIHMLFGLDKFEDAKTTALFYSAFSEI
jgi:hypothetical protein